MPYSRQKRKEFFSFLFLLIIASFPGVLPGQDIFQLIRFQFGAADIDHFTKNELLEPQNSLILSLDYNDYVRQYENHRKLFSGAGFVNQAEYTYIRPADRWQYGLKVNLGNAKSEFDNQESATALTGINNYSSDQGALSLAVSDGIALWGAGFKFQSIDNNIPLQINSFPVSTNLAMNQYFLDYLESSFGTNLVFEEDIKLLQPLLFASFPLNKSIFFSLSFSQSRYSLFQQLRYTNNSNIPQLTGSRKINIEGTIITNSAKFALKSSNWRFTPHLIVHDSRLNLDLKNLLPLDITLDLPDLGWLTGTRRGFDIGYSSTNEKFGYQINFGFMTVSADVDVSTPVLGRELLPIAHGVIADLNGQATTQHFNLSKTWQHSNIFITGSLDYSHAYYDLTINGDAIIEFGFASVPVKAPLQYHLQLGELSIQMAYRIKKYHIGYQFRQYLPYFNRVDSSELKFRPEKPAPDLKNRGGGQHHIYLTINLD